MLSDARGNHVSPGIYTEEKDVTYSVKSLGITSLGLVGETLYGPAFENVEIESWSDFIDYFGGTSPEKFKGTGLPKYELPYVAKSYLEESKRLNVVRVLGLSGYKAGPVWVIGESGSTGTTPVVILRSKMTYNANTDDPCQASTDDTPSAVVKDIKIGEYQEPVYNSECVQDTGKTATASTIAGNQYFSLTVTCRDDVPGFNKEYKYNVTLDKGSSNYIYNVLSNKPDTGTTPIYIEAIYENSFTGGQKLSMVSSGLSAETGTTGIYFETSFVSSAGTGSNLTYRYEINLVDSIPLTASAQGYTDLTEENDGDIISTSARLSTYLFVKTADVYPYQDFLEGYRPAQTPWIVSDAVVEYNAETEETKANVRKLFKFITISDGDASNYQVKVSIQNIKPEEGTFDVIVRDFNDTDASPVILERFARCNLVEGDRNYVAFKIGSSDGGYEAKSKYIVVEMAESEDLSNSVPAGFLGFPMPKYGCSNRPKMTYNTEYIATLKAKKQYFGMSDITGVDTDVLAYKGKYFYTYGGDDDPTMITDGFHMDSAMSDANPIYVDGVSGYTFETVSKKKVTQTLFAPRLINASYINSTLYKDVNTRKFTVYFYGGFDGWDVNREQRSNTDKFKATNYNVSGSSIFSNVLDYNGLNAQLNLPSTAITTDYYAYLAGYRVFANPQDVEINVFATPGIDWYNNMLLTEEAIDVIEDTDDGRGGDALYVMNSPYSLDADELASAFLDTEINSSYACTYAPWVMYYDSSNSRYLNLPVTKDVVRNMAATDNTLYPWYAPAGLERGNVNCIKAAFKTTLANEDTLYENRINPVKSFSVDGVKIWGNKTAYTVDSPLNRINVRRLMIRVKKLVTEAARNLIFTQYDDTLDSQFRSLVDPILSDVKTNKGISDYRIQTEVTAETKDQHILPAKILIKPVGAVEYISISFVVYPESVEFEE